MCVCVCVCVRLQLSDEISFEIPSEVLFSFW